MTPAQLHILQHSLGVDKYGQGRRYRNRFVTGPGTSDFEPCNELVKEGMMERQLAPWAGPDEWCYWVTLKGEQAMTKESPQPPKLARK